MAGEHKKLKCYYAHCMLSYDSTIEKKDIELLEKLRFEVINPNTPEISKGCNDYVAKHGKGNVMHYFEKIVSECDVIAFRSLPDGQIPSGVAAEVKAAISWGKMVIELPCSVNKRCQEYPETKEYLTEIGFYKNSF